MSKELVSSRLIIPFADTGDNLFLARRVASSRHYPEMWELPGGTVEPGETVTGSAKREIYEETGLTVKIGHLALLACDRDWCRDDSEIPYIVYSFYSLQSDYHIEDVRLNPDEHTDYQITTLDAANHMDITPDSQRAINHYQRRLADLSYRPTVQPDQL